MLQNIEKSGEEDNERAKEWLMNTDSNWLNRTVSSRGSFKLIKSRRKRKRMVLRMLGEYRPWYIKPELKYLFIGIHRSRDQILRKGGNKFFHYVFTRPTFLFIKRSYEGR